MTSSEPKSVKVLFNLVQDEDGYPSAGSETMWAEQLADGTYRIDNIAFYARDAAWDDIVSAKVINGELVYTGLVKASGNSLLRVVVFDKDELAKIRKELKGLGCDSEWDGQLVAVNVPANIDYAPILRYLLDGERAERLTFEEAVLCHESIAAREEEGSDGSPKVALRKTKRRRTS